LRKHGAKRSLVDTDARGEAVAREGASLRSGRLAEPADELERSRDYYKSLFDDQPIGRLVLDAGGLIKAINGAAARLLRREATSLAGKPFIEFVADGYRRVFLEHLRAAQSGMPEPIRDSVDLRGDDSWVPVQLVTRAFKRPEGIECNTAIVALPPSHESGMGKLAPLLGQANDAIIVRTPDGRVMAWNTAAQALYGYSEREVLGANVFPLLCPHPLAQFKQAEADLARNDRWEGELALRKRDGTRISVESRWGLVRSADGIPQAVVQIDRDLTRRHAMEIAARNRARRASARSQPDLSDLASVLSYDVQEPLRALVGYLDLLKQRYRGKAGREADEFSELAREEAQRLQGMIDDVRAYCLAAAGEADAEVVPVADALRAALVVLQPAISSIGATIQHTELPVARVAPGDLREVLVRLLSNSLKFRGRRPVEVALSGRVVGSMVEISVADNGIGVALAERDRLFRPFGRLHTAEEFPGRGMGLAIARRIVEHWGGRIWFESVPGEGATFSFTLPSAAGPEDDDAGAGPLTPPRPTAR
jgi:PAS domain S-box-containing protein